MSANVRAPVLGSVGGIYLDLVVRPQGNFAPISACLADVISDTDTVDSLFIAWEAARCRWGAAVDSLSIGLSDTSHTLLKSRRWMVEGDSLGLAAFLSIAMHFQRYFFGYRRVVATGAIEWHAGSFRVRSVGGVKQKFRGACREHESGATAIVVPWANVSDLDVRCCVHDVWLAGPDLGCFRSHVTERE